MAYDGEQTVVHKVRQGESLSAIADKYGFRNWKPLYNYNTKVNRVLGPNPDELAAGVEIVIPRTKQGYDKLIRKLKLLRDQLRAEGHRLGYELEGEYNKHQATRVAFDFAGDVATLLGTVAAKSAKVARAAKTATTATGSAKPAAEYLARKEAQKLTSSLKGTLKDKAVSAWLGSEHSDFPGLHKDLYLTQKKGISAIRGVSLKGGKSFLDIADILLDYVSVSNVADGVIAMTVGETPVQSYKKAIGQMQRTVSRSCSALDQKIQRYSRERALVHGAH